MGAPTDVYLNGAMFVWIPVAVIICIPMGSYLYLPVFHQLQVVSVNQVRDQIHIYIVLSYRIYKKIAKL